MARQPVQSTVWRLVATGVAGLIAATLASGQQPGSIKAVRKISAAQGGLSVGITTGDAFASALAPLGDFDGDGVPDLAVGAPDDDEGGLDRGAVHLLFLLADGTVKQAVTISDAAGGFTGDIEDGDGFGRSIAALGDIDGDGIGDIAVGAIGDDDGGSLGQGSEVGAVWILRLNIDGTVKSHTKISASSGGFSGSLSDGDHFGSAVACLGDIDGDGVKDLAVGADTDSSLWSVNGAVWIAFLNPGGTVKGQHRIDASEPAFGGVVNNVDSYLGASLVALGDIDQDGTPDLVAGMPGENNPGVDSGAVYSLLLNPDGSLKAFGKNTAPIWGPPGELADSDEFGHATTSIGDLDGDGMQDLAVGAWLHQLSSTQSGEVWLLFQLPNGSTRSTLKISAASPALVGQIDDGDRFGASVAAIGDLDGDAVIDLAVGAQFDDDGAVNAGALYILFLNGAANQQAYAPFTSALDGRGGRPTLIKPPPAGVLPGDEEFGVPIVPVPNTTEAFIDVQTLNHGAGAELVFDSGGTFETGLFPTMAVQAELSGDGKLDIVTSNKGDGTFSYLAAQPGVGLPPFASNIDTVFPTSGQPIALAIADFDGDTDKDVAVAGQGVAGAGGVAVYLNDGAANFTMHDFTIVDHITDLVVGDVTGDGKPDIVTASGVQADPPVVPENGFATVLVNDGLGALSTAGTFATGHAVASVLLLDADQDTDLDALLAIHEVDSGPGGTARGLIELHLGDGAGSFAPSTNNPIDVSESPADPLGIHPTYGAVGLITSSDAYPDVVYTTSDNISHDPAEFADLHPPIVLHVLINDQAGGFTVTKTGTAYSGKAVAPILDDIAPLPPDGFLDCILVWYEDTVSGQNDIGGASLETFSALLVGHGGGAFLDPTPNQFLTGADPSDGDTGDVNGDATDAPTGGVDIVVPNMASNTLSVLLGDGSGSIPAPAITVPDIDKLNPGSLGSGSWEGGPRQLRLVSLDPDAHLDAVVYNAWHDESFLNNPPAASLSLLLGDGSGDLFDSQYLPLPQAGEMEAVDLDGDQAVDVVVTQRSAPGQHHLAVHLGNGDGTVAPAAAVFAAPGGFDLTGGLAAFDLDSDGDRDIVTTGRDGLGAGAVVVYVKSGAPFTLAPAVHPAGAAWTDVRSLDVGDVTGDGKADVVVGIPDGRLVIVAGDGLGGYTPFPTNAQAANTGGGALRLADLDGDAELDIVSCTSTAGSQSSQAFVRALSGRGDGTFDVETLPGVHASGSQGALRPIVVDLNRDAANDVVLIHGEADAVSALVNQLSSFVTYGVGHPGKDGITPLLTGTGYSTPGGHVTVHLAGALGGSPAMLFIGLGQNLAPPLHVQTTYLKLALFTQGTPGQAGGGSLTLPFVIPPDPTLVGIEITMQMLVRDLNAGPPAPFKISMSNGLAMTIVD